MKLTQVHQGDRLVAAIVEGDKYRLIPGQTTASLIVQAEISGKPLATIAAALAVNSKGEIQGYMLGNDVSAWDIERENALYLPQSKVFDRCVALGPVLVTPDEIANPYELQMTCTIQRGAQTTFSGACSTNQLRRKFEELVKYLLKSNTVPSATVLFTGTGIIVTQEAALQPGDVVTISVPEIGTLANPAVIV